MMTANHMKLFEFWFGFLFSGMKDLFDITEGILWIITDSRPFSYQRRLFSNIYVTLNKMLKEIFPTVIRTFDLYFLNSLNSLFH